VIFSNTSRARKYFRVSIDDQDKKHTVTSLPQMQC